MASKSCIKWSELKSLSLTLRAAKENYQIVHVHVFGEDEFSSRMQSETFTNEDVIGVCSSLVNVKLTCNGPEFALLSKAYAVDVVPCSILIDSNYDSSVSSQDHVRLAVGGFVQPVDFVSLVRDVVDSHKQAYVHQSESAARVTDTAAVAQGVDKQAIGTNDTARVQTTSQEQRTAVNPQSNDAQSASTLRNRTTAGKNAAAASTAVRIQLRYLDGSFENALFAVSDHLTAVRSRVAESGRVTGHFTLSCKTSQPPRDFGDSDAERRLDELGLAPSAVLLVKPSTGRLGDDKPAARSKSRAKAGSHSEARRDGQLSVVDQTWALMRSVVTLLIVPFLAVWTLMNVYVLEPFRARTAQASASANSSNVQQPADRQPTDHRSANSRRSPAANLGASEVREIRQGRIRRLVAGRPDDDPNATWNGNSTQQL